MRRRTSRSEFLALLLFLTVMCLLLANGFEGRVRAQGEDIDVYPKIEPIADVLVRILDEYYREPDVDRVVEGALQGMMISLDKHSSFIPAEALQELEEETQGEFEGIGVTISADEEGNIVVGQPLPGQPAERAGIMTGDRIIKVDGASTEGMTTYEAAELIRGPRGTRVVITVERDTDTGEVDVLDIEVERGKIPLESIKEARVLDSGIGYVRVSDFKKNTDDDLGKRMREMLAEGMTSLVLDLRWNSGGLLSSSKEVCELFLPKNTLVTYIEGRPGKDGGMPRQTFYTERKPILPEGFPVIILVNEQTASSAEIVTGALQFWSKALILGVKTYGKGSVQTIIPLKRPVDSALRLTTALYYTPAEVTIHNEGIKPDIEVAMDIDHQRALWRQMWASHEKDPGMVDQQNHGHVTGNGDAKPTLMYTAVVLDAEGNPVPDASVSISVDDEDATRSYSAVSNAEGEVVFQDKIIEDTQLQRAVEILSEDSVFANLLAKYHKDTSETQVEAGHDEDDAGQTPEPDADSEKPEKE